MISVNAIVLARMQRLGLDEWCMSCKKQDLQQAASWPTFLGIASELRQVARGIERDGGQR